ncbi:MAG: hypothetical protein WCH34_04875 [Bacteroidota bacterium]
MKSIFNFRAYLLPALFLFFISIGLASLIDVINKFNIENNEKQIIMSLLIICVFTLLILHEIRTKIIVLLITKNKIEVKSWLTKKIIFDFKEIDGFQTRIVKGKLEKFEYLYLFKNNKKILTLSQTYHKNYFDLKSKINEECKNLGVTKFGTIKEIIEVLTLK